MIPARSENDTGNNPHNPMYGICTAGADGTLLTLIGSYSSDRAAIRWRRVMMDPAARPTKVDRTSDVTGLVDTGKLVGLLDQRDAVAVLESIERISRPEARPRGQPKLGTRRTRSSRNWSVRLREVGRTSPIASATPSGAESRARRRIVGHAGDSIFTRAEYDGDGEFRKTAAVMKMVINGYAGAGTIADGRLRLSHGRAARPARLATSAPANASAPASSTPRASAAPLMIYVFSDGSLSSNGQVDNTVDGRGKGVWTSDNQATAAPFFLVYNPAGRPALFSRRLGTGRAPSAARVLPSGRLRGDRRHAAAENVNLLVETVVLNYMALHGEQNLFATANYFPGHGLGSTALLDSLTAFNPIVNGRIT